MSIVDSLLKEPTMPHDGGTPASPRSSQPELAVPSSAADVTRGTGTVQDKQPRGYDATRADGVPAGRSHGGAGTQCRAMEVANWMTTDSVLLGETSSVPNGQPPQGGYSGTRVRPRTAGGGAAAWHWRRSRASSTYD